MDRYKMVSSGKKKKLRKIKYKNYIQSYGEREMVSSGKKGK